MAPNLLTAHSTDVSELQEKSHWLQTGSVLHKLSEDGLAGDSGIILVLGCEGLLVRDSSVLAKELHSSFQV